MTTGRAPAPDIKLEVLQAAFSLRIDAIAAMLNCELADTPSTTASSFNGSMAPTIGPAFRRPSPSLALRA